MPREALLNRYCEIRDDQYVQVCISFNLMFWDSHDLCLYRFVSPFQTTDTRMRIEVIGQRLLSGRVAISQAALVFARKLFDRTKAYAENKKCWAPKGEPTLSSMPQLAHVLQKGYRQLDALNSLGQAVEEGLNAVLMADGIPSTDLVEAIAALKIAAVESSIENVHRLKQEVGSYALMAGSGFEHTDILQCCKFAEGDSRILMQKLARDTLKAYTKQGEARSAEEGRLCAALVSKLTVGVGNGRSKA